MVLDAPLYAPALEYVRALPSRQKVVDDLRGAAAGNSLTMLVGHNDSGKSTALRNAFPDATFISCALSDMVGGYPGFGYSGAANPQGAQPLTQPLHQIKPTGDKILVLEEAGVFYEAAKIVGQSPLQYLERLQNQWDSIVLEVHHPRLAIETIPARPRRLRRKQFTAEMFTPKALEHWKSLLYYPNEMQLSRGSNTFFASLQEPNHNLSIVYMPLLSHNEMLGATQLLGLPSNEAEAYAKLVGGYLVPLYDGKLPNNFAFEFTPTRPAFFDFAGDAAVAFDLYALTHHYTLAFESYRPSVREALRDAHNGVSSKASMVTKNLERVGITEGGRIRSALEDAIVGATLAYNEQEGLVSASAYDRLNFGRLSEETQQAVVNAFEPDASQPINERFRRTDAKLRRAYQFVAEFDPMKLEHVPSPFGSRQELRPWNELTQNYRALLTQLVEQRVPELAEVSWWSNACAFDLR